MIKIISVLQSSAAERLGLQTNDQLLSINSNLINDKLDFTYFIQEDNLVVEILRDDKKISLSVEENDCFSETDWGIELEDYQIKNCGNNCIFCFVHQNPKGLRDTLYVKDEDYRFSFLHGSYFTLTNITQPELERIVTMRLSPLYISVHATAPDVRKKLLGIKREDKFLDKVKFLVQNNIELHTQIVLCPDINDGEVLKQTVSDLAAYYPGVASVAVVPLGKTAHRENLPQIRSVSVEDAAQTIKIIDQLQSDLLAKIETRFVYAADEFYLKSGIPIPSEGYYENFDQYENGIGLVRSFLDELASYKKIPKSIKKSKTVFFVTGKAFGPVLKGYLLPLLEKIKNLHPYIIEVENQLFGKEVTVAGLLCGKDILAAILAESAKPDLIVLPPTSLNYDDLFLDDMSISEFSSKAKTKSECYSSVAKLFKIIAE